MKNTEEEKLEYLKSLKFTKVPTQNKYYSLLYIDISALEIEKQDTIEDLKNLIMKFVKLSLETPHDNNEQQ